MHCPLVLEMNDESLLESWELVWVDHLGPGLVEPLNSPFVDCRARGGGTDERGSCLTCVWGTLRDIGQFLTLPFVSTPSSTGTMSEREERRFVEIPRESVRLMAESTGLELSDEVAALLAEDVCYRLREATQVRCSQLSLALLPLFFPVTPSHTGCFNKHMLGTLCFEVSRQSRSFKESLSKPGSDGVC